MFKVQYNIKLTFFMCCLDITAVDELLLIAPLTAEYNQCYKFSILSQFKGNQDMIFIIF